MLNLVLTNWEQSDQRKIRTGNVETWDVAQTPIRMGGIDTNRNTQSGEHCVGSQFYTVLYCSIGQFCLFLSNVFFPKRFN